MEKVYLVVSAPFLVILCWEGWADTVLPPTQTADGLEGRNEWVVSMATALQLECVWVGWNVNEASTMVVV